MPLLEQITAARDNAMKNKDTAVRDTLRVLCSSVKNKQIEMGRELTDEEVVAVIKSQVKQLSDALQEFDAAGREDLVAANQQEIDILSQYLPEQLSDETLEQLVREVMTSAGDGAQFGQVMGMAVKQAGGSVDGVRIKEMVQKLMNS